MVEVGCTDWSIFNNPLNEINQSESVISWVYPDATSGVKNGKKKMGSGVQPASEALSLIDTSFLWNSKNILPFGAADTYIGEYLSVQVPL